MVSRYFDVIFYAVASYLLLFFFGQTEWWDKWNSTYRNIHSAVTSDLGPLYIQLVHIITGFLLTTLITNFQIYHPNRPFYPNFRFPPLTFAVGIIIIVWVFNFQPDFIDLISSCWGVFLGLTLLPTIHLSRFWPKVKARLNQVEGTSVIDFEKLDEEPKQAARVLLEKLNSDCHHIALCGAFGTGKTSVINTVLREFKRDRKSQIIECNVELWGVSTDSIAEFVLQEITLALYEHIDVSGLRQLPMNYLEAIKSSNSSWGFLSHLMKKRQAVDSILRELENTLRVVKKTVFVTIQDIDRNENASACMTELAGLLERIKQYKPKQITYIFAAENTPQFSETIRRICPVRIDIGRPNLVNRVDALHVELINSLPENYLYKLTGKNYEYDSEITAQLLSSFRSFENLEGLVKQVWGLDNKSGNQIFGEVLPHELILMLALKSEVPKVFDLVMIADSTNGHDTLKQIVEKYMPDVSLHEKFFIFRVFKYLGYFSESALGLYGLNTDLEDNDDSHEFDRFESIEFAGAPNLLSVVNEDRKNLVRRGARLDSDYSHWKAYNMFHSLAKGECGSIDSFIERMMVQGKEYLLFSFRYYPSFRT